MSLADVSKPSIGVKKSSRRHWLGWLGGIAVLASTAVIFRKPLLSQAIAQVVDNNKFDIDGLAALDADMCKVTAKAMEGPFFVTASPLRSDLRETQTGEILKLTIKFVNAKTCLPISGAEAHIWGANASGLYSGYEAHDPDKIELTPGHLPVETESRFLRGHQITNGLGVVEFITIVPAWYSFRTPHIHVKVLLPNKEEFTTQFYFPEEINTIVRETAKPYSARPSPLVSNRSDPIIRNSQGAAGGWLKVKKTAASYEGTITIGVVQASNPII